MTSPVVKSVQPTRTISAHQALSPFGQLRLLVGVSTSRPRSLSGFRRVRRGPRKGEAKVITAVQAEHDSVGHLLESRYAAATVEVAEALRERDCRSIDNAHVIEREVLAGFAAPLDSYLRVAGHDRARKLETASTGSTPGIIRGAGLAFARAWYSWLEGLAATVRKYCRRPRPVRFRFRRNQCGLGDNFALVLAHCCKRFVAPSVSFSGGSVWAAVVILISRWPPRQSIAFGKRPEDVPQCSASRPLFRDSTRGISVQECLPGCRFRGLASFPHNRIVRLLEVVTDPHSEVRFKKFAHNVADMFVPSEKRLAGLSNRLRTLSKDLEKVAKLPGFILGRIATCCT